MKNKTYNGHKNWNHWNVSLWINNDERLHRFANQLVGEFGKDKAARLFVANMGQKAKTPDGAPYSLSAVRAAMAGM